MKEVKARSSGFATVRLYRQPVSDEEERLSNGDDLVRETLRPFLAAYVRLRSEHTGVDGSNGA